MVCMKSNLDLVDIVMENGSRVHLLVETQESNNVFPKDFSLIVRNATLKNRELLVKWLKRLKIANISYHDGGEDWCQWSGKSFQRQALLVRMSLTSDAKILIDTEDWLRICKRIQMIMKNRLGFIASNRKQHLRNNFEKSIYDSLERFMLQTKYTDETINVVKRQICLVEQDRSSSAAAEYPNMENDYLFPTTSSFPPDIKQDFVNIIPENIFQQSSTSLKGPIGNGGFASKLNNISDKDFIETLFPNW